MNKIQIGFGGGCHWCTEAVFQAIKGVSEVQQGYISTAEDPDTFYEGILLQYDPAVVTLDTLVEIHLKTHQSASNHSMRSQYLSAVYTFNFQQKLAVTGILDKNASEIITKAVLFGKFEESREQIQNYYFTDPERPFCKRYIKPKLELLKKEFKNSIHQ